LGGEGKTNVLERCDEEKFLRNRRERGQRETGGDPRWEKHIGGGNMRVNPWKNGYLKTGGAVLRRDDGPKGTSYPDPGLPEAFHPKKGSRNDSRAKDGWGGKGTWEKI